MPSYYSVTSEPFLHEDWSMANPGPWRESHPWGVSYEATPEGLAHAQTDMDHFAATGEDRHGDQMLPGTDRYVINYSMVTINLLNIGDQRVLDLRFPMVTESSTHHDMERQTLWTNHPECVLRTWVEELFNPPVEETQRWYHLELDVSALLWQPGTPRSARPVGR